MQEHMNRMPLNKAQLEGVKAVYAGIGPTHDDQKIAEARKRYERKFVDRVLAHEQELTAGYGHK